MRKRGTHGIGEMKKYHERNPSATPDLLLTEAPTGVPLRVAGINAGRQAQSRLASMGILPGEVIRIVRRENGGPLLLEVKGTRVALGRGVSLKVTVQDGNGIAES